MSTEVAVKEKRGFKKPQAPIMPTLYCVGTMGKIENAKISKSGNYVTVPLEILGKGAAKNHKIWFTFHPEWLDFSFDVNTLEGKEGSPDLVYGSNIASEKGLSTLQGIAGSEENFMELCERLAAVEFDADKETEYLKAVTKVIKDFFSEFKPLIGYTLSQKNEKTGVDEDGKGIYQRTRFYEIFFWYPTDEKLEAYEKKAAESAEKYNEALEANKEAKASGGDLVKVPKLSQVTWNEETPF